MHTTHLLFFGQIFYRLIFLTFLIILIPLSYIFIYIVIYIFSCRFYYLNLIFDIKYFTESSQFSELPSVFNSVKLIEFPTNHLLYFMDFYATSSKYAPYFYMPIFVFTSLLFILLLSECNSNNRKNILSLKRSKYQPQIKKKSF